MINESEEKKIQEEVGDKVYYRGMGTVKNLPELGVESQPLLVFLMRFLNRWESLDVKQEDESYRAFQYLTDKEKAEYLIEEIMRRYV